MNSDCRNLNRREIVAFPVPDALPAAKTKTLGKLLGRLMGSYKANSTMKTVHYAGKGAITVQYFNFRPSKPIIDEIDDLLLDAYGLTEIERDFIINYEIKYRLCIRGGEDTNV